MKKRNMQARSALSGEGLQEFDRQLNELGRYAPVTAALVAVNVIVWIYTLVHGADWFQPSDDALKAFGANFGPLTTHDNGWRLLTACFLHVGLVQLVINQWVLWQYGRWLERFFGHLGFALLYILTGIASSLVAVRWQPEAVLAGSTGAIAGLIGAVAAFCWRMPGAVPALALNRLRAGTFLFLGYNVGYAMYLKRLDAAGFLSGLAFGFIGGLVLSQPYGGERRPRRWSRNSVLAALGLMLVVAQPYLLLPDPTLEFDEVQKEKMQALDAFQSAYDDFVSGRMEATKFLHVLGTDVLLPWERAERRLEALSHRHLGSDADKIVSLALKSMKMREDGWKLLGDSVAANSEEGQRRAEEQLEAATRVEAEAAEVVKQAERKRDEKND
jgi:rhomboid protease GluP